MKKNKLKDITVKQIQKMLLTKQQIIIVDLLIHYYMTVIETVPVRTGLTRTSFTIGINAPVDYDPSEGHYGMPQAPSAKALLAALQGKELRVFVGTSVDHKGYIEKQYQTQLLAWHDVVKYARENYPEVFGG